MDTLSKSIIEYFSYFCSLDIEQKREQTTYDARLYYIAETYQFDDIF